MKAGVVTHPGQELQLGAGLADGSAERGPHAEVARVKDQHGALILVGLPPLGDQGGQSRVPAAGRVVVERERGVVRGRAHPYKARVHVVGMQDGEGLLHRLPRLLFEWTEWHQRIKNFGGRIQTDGLPGSATVLGLRT